MIIDKVHKDLVTRIQPPPANTAARPATQRSTMTTSAPSLRVIVASALAKTDLGLSIPLELVNDDVIITRTKHKMQIIQDYETKYGGDFPKSIVTRQKGKHSHQTNTITPTCMLQSIKKYYRVQELLLYNVITTVIKEY